MIQYKPANLIKSQTGADIYRPRYIKYGTF